MALFSRIGRWFTIKTRFEAWLVIYAIALGAVERGRHYLDIYPGAGGWSLALACTGVVFVAGAKLLESVRPPEPAIALGTYAGLRRTSRETAIRRSRPRLRQSRRASR